MKIPFNIKYRPQIESGEYKVFAREHEEQEARIVCWDNRGEYPIVALVDNEPEKFDKHGRVPGGDRGGEFSLFLVTPEEELTEFEDGLRKVCEEAVTEAVVFPDRTSENFAKTHSAELLALAEKEIAKGHEHDVYIPEDTYYEQLKKQWEDGCGKGKAEALRTRATELTKNLANSGLDEDSIPYHLIEFMCNLYTCQNWKEIEETAEAYVTRIEAAAMKDLPRWRKAVKRSPVGQSIMFDEYGFYIAITTKPGCRYITCDSLAKLPGFNE